MRISCVWESLMLCERTAPALQKRLTQGIDYAKTDGNRNIIVRIVHEFDMY